MLFVNTVVALAKLIANMWTARSSWLPKTGGNGLSGFSECGSDAARGAPACLQRLLVG